MIAASTEPHADAGTATEAIQRVREQANEADLIEFEEAAFQVYEADSGEWGWRLIDEAGKLVAEDPATHPTRDAARRAMNRLLEHLESDVRTMERAVFQTYAAEDWHWRFVLPTGETVAVDDGGYATRDELVESLEDVRETADAARGYTIGDVTVQLYDSGEWRWRLLDRDREEIADGDDSYPDERGAQNAVEALAANVTDAPIFAIEEAAIRLDGGDGWNWELVDRDREVLAGATDAAETREAALSAIDDVRQLAPMAGTVDFDVASFELVADEDGRWRWRLIDEDGRTVASGSETYDTSAAARDALADVRELIERASILEIDSVSFELHTAEDGWVWQLVDEYGSTMARSTRTYETRTDAHEAMNDVKAHAPEGWISFTE